MHRRVPGPHPVGGIPPVVALRVGVQGARVAEAVLGRCEAGGGPGDERADGGREHEEVPEEEHGADDGAAARGAGPDLQGEADEAGGYDDGGDGVDVEFYGVGLDGDRRGVGDDGLEGGDVRGPGFPHGDEGDADVLGFLDGRWICDDDEGVHCGAGSVGDDGAEEDVREPSDSEEGEGQGDEDVEEVAGGRGVDVTDGIRAHDVLSDQREDILVDGDVVRDAPGTGGVAGVREGFERGGIGGGGYHDRSCVYAGLTMPCVYVFIYSFQVIS